MKDHFESGARMVSECEQDTARVEHLLKKSESAGLDSSRWREVSTLFETHQRNKASQMAWLEEMSDRIPPGKSNPEALAAEKMAAALREQLIDVHSHWNRLNAHYEFARLTLDAKPGVLSLEASLREAPAERLRDAPTEGEAPAEGLLRSLCRDSNEHSAAARKREYGSRVPYLPWLTPFRNFERLVDNRNLEILAGSPKLPANLQQEVHLYSCQLWAFEREALRAHELLGKSRSRRLSGTERRELLYLVNSTRERMLSGRKRLGSIQGEFEKADALERTARHQFQRTEQRLDWTGLLLHELPREATTRRFKTALPIESGDSAVVESHLIPGTALGGTFADDYPLSARTGRLIPWHRHVPNLAVTALTNAARETLFCGLRHSHLGLVVDDVDARTLSSLHVNELDTLIGDLLIREGRTESARMQQVYEHREWIQADPNEAERSMHLMRHRVRQNRARQVAAAGLVADPGKFRKALEGETVDLDLFVVKLPDAHPLANQRDVAAFDELLFRSPVELKLHDSDGKPLTALVNVKVRWPQWNHSPGETLPLNRQSTANDFSRLLGPASSPEPGGDVKAGVDALLTRAASLRGEHDALKTSLARTSQEQGKTHPESIASHNRLSSLMDQVEGLERKARTLLEAAGQIKALCAEARDRPAGGEPREGELRKDEPHKGGLRQEEPYKDETRKGETHKGELREGEPHKGKLREDETRKDETRKDATHKGELREDETRKDGTRKDETHKDETHKGELREGELREGETREGETREGETRKDETHKDETHKGETHKGELREGELHKDKLRRDKLHEDKLLKKVASRLLLTGHLMGEMPVLSYCPSDAPSPRDATARFDAEVKFLAAFADIHNGRLPPADLKQGAWPAALKQFEKQLATGRNVAGGP